MVKVTPIYESNIPNNEDNPAYVVSKLIDMQVEDEEDTKPKEDVPRYVTEQIPEPDHPTGTGT